MSRPRQTGAPARRAVAAPRRPWRSLLVGVGLTILAVVLAGLGVAQLARAGSADPVTAPEPTDWELASSPDGATSATNAPAPTGDTRVTGGPTSPIGRPTAGSRGATPVAARTQPVTESPGPAAVGSSGGPAGQDRSAGARLIIDDLGVSAPIDRVGSAAGELLLPDALDRIGQWSGGSELVDNAGTVLLAGHLALGDRPGVGQRWHTLQPGAVIDTIDEVGHRRRWRAVKLQVHDAHEIPVDLFAATGPNRLALVTCAGPVVTVNGRREYRDNLVIVAEPF